MGNTYEALLVLFYHAPIKCLVGGTSKPDSSFVLVSLSFCQIPCSSIYPTQHLPRKFPETHNNYKTFS
ncbi:hypothetical protein RJT34_31087 [Clitoria ternatea]|uniref:Uncharacterized protein n=1 Tax=Clitoria ternatea TaxID=43366 RepID=A0AAN9EUD6_CLITE